MAYFWDELNFLVGGRFTSLSYMSLRQWPTEVDHEIVLLGQFLWLPPGQHVDVEEDFLESHLPYRRAMFGVSTTSTIRGCSPSKLHRDQWCAKSGDATPTRTTSCVRPWTTR